MKYYKSYLSALLLFSLIFTSCKNEENFENKVYINSSSRISNLLIKSSIRETEQSIQAALAKPESKDVELNYKVEPNFLDTYNKAYYDNAVILPSEYYDFPESKVTIASGAVRSKDLTLYFKDINKLDRDSVYVLPLTIENANISVLESARTNYYVFKGAALINVVADLEGNYLHINKWAKPEVVNNLTLITMEALVRASNYDRMINTVMGIEGGFLIRLGDANFPANQIQVATNVGNFPSADSNKGLPLNEWVHIALTFNAPTRDLKVYVNGTIQSEGKLPLSKVNLGVGGADGFYIGRSYADDRYFAGEFSECRIWNVVRTQEEIAANPYEVDATADGLVAYWKCDEGAGSIVKDHTANGNHMSAKKDIKWVPVSLPAK